MAVVEASSAPDNGTSCCPSHFDVFQSCFLKALARSSIDDVVPVRETQMTATTMSGTGLEADLREIAA